MKKSSALEEYFWDLLKTWGVQHMFAREVRFDPERRWRFDFCNRIDQIAVEIEGGTFSGGRHTRGGSFAKDAEKYNRATAMGYRVFRFSTKTAMRDFYNLYAELLQHDLRQPK